MWPPSFGGVSQFIRIGARELELWAGSSGALRLVAGEPLKRRASLYDVQPMVVALPRLLAQVEAGSIAIVLESAFVPVLLADTGGVLWKREQVENLLRHHFGLAYGGPGVGTAAWSLRTDHRFGDRWALGFAMPSSVEQALTSVEAGLGRRFAAWLPALAWSMERPWPSQRRPFRKGRWIWVEQDRFIVADLSGRRVVALHPALPLSAGVEAASRWSAAVGIEASTESAVGAWRADEIHGAPVGMQRMLVDAAAKPPSSPSVRRDAAVVAEAR